jgi:transcriptional regulator with XRE-family HTH domain
MRKSGYFRSGGAGSVSAGAWGDNEMAGDSNTDGPEAAASPKDAGPIDQLIGKRVMMCRRERGLSQAALAEQLGISFQQLQKYEQGQNRTTVARLAKIASKLEAPIGYFLKGAVALTHSDLMRELQDEAREEFDIYHLLTAFLEIEEDDVRRMIVNLARAAADGVTPDRPFD